MDCRFYCLTYAVILTAMDYFAIRVALRPRLINLTFLIYGCMEPFVYLQDYKNYGNSQIALKNLRTEYLMIPTILLLVSCSYDFLLLGGSFFFLR
jgi:hypothetical protein